MTGDGLPGHGDVGYFVSLVHGDVLDVSKWGMSQNGGPVIVWHRKSTDVLNQRWAVRAIGESAFEISPLCTPDHALDHVRAPARYHIDDAVVHWDRHGRRSQSWTFLAGGSGAISIVNLDSDGAVSAQGHGKQLLVVPRASDDVAQLWRFELLAP